ncbi:MAG: hypothetical protein SCM88_03840 [Bacillota bacterium]|nr:hypothetical protein [Bacillota bacterium]
MREKYLKINLPGCTVFLTTAEILSLLHKDVDLYQEVIKRGKAFRRAEDNRRRQAAHFEKHYNRDPGATGLYDMPDD